MKIFISYRRAEDNKSYLVGTIHEKLATAFGKENVFRDLYDIAGGTDWRSVLEREVNSCKIMLVVIGPDWANLAYPNGEKRLFDPQDVTRWEIETGLRRRREDGISIIPVLITGANMPKGDELPETMHEILKIQGVSLRNFPDFDRDMEKLVQDISSSQGFIVDDIEKEKYEPKTMRIHEGSFWMGVDAGEGVPEYETPKHEVFLPAYRIGIRPVTNKEFEFFIRKTNRQVPIVMGWNGQSITVRLVSQPVVGVTWDDAIEYCGWLSKETGRNYFLPNEAQWEKACRGAYPNLVFPADLPEWTCSLWGEKRLKPDPAYFYPWKDDERNDSSTNRHLRRVLRKNSSGRLGRSINDAGVADSRHSFRVALSI